MLYPNIIKRYKLLLLSGLLACQMELDIHQQTDPRNRYLQTDGRPDITFYNIDSGVTYECDVSLNGSPLEERHSERSCKGMQTCMQRQTGIRKMLQIFKGDLAIWI